MRELFGYESVAAGVVDFGQNMPPPKVTVTETEMDAIAAPT
jgi:hypothetical protein